MRLYRWFLRAYPRDFRARFANGMCAAFAEDAGRARARGITAWLWFLVVACLHALSYGIAERLPRRASIGSFFSVDLRDAVRSLRATPVVSAVAVLSLALGIGANTALFTIMNGLVLRPLPVHEPQRLAVLAGEDWTNPIWEQIRDRQAAVFDGAAAWSPETFNLAAHGRTDPVGGSYVSGGLFQLLGVGTVAGRPLQMSDDVPGGGREGHVAVISHRFWQARFNGSRDAIGRHLSVHGVPFTIVGVAPAGFLGADVGRASDVFLPLAAEAAIRGKESTLANRSSWWLQVMVRLKPGQTLEGGAAALNAMRPQIREATMPQGWTAEYRANYLSTDFTLAAASTGVSSLRRRFEQPLTIIMAVVGAVLLIACANIANLMLARASARRREMSLRLALGASRARLTALLLTESLLLAIVGATAGLALAQSGAGLLIRQLGTEVNTVALDVPIDWRVLLFTAAVTLTATFLFGLAPAAGLGKVQPNEALKRHGRTVAGDRRFGFRNALVVLQVALSFAVVAGAGLFLRTFAALQSTDLGFNPQNLLIATVDASLANVPAGERLAFADRVRGALASTPGVARASLSFLTPMSGSGWNNRIQVLGEEALPRNQQMVWLNAITPGWLETYEMRALAGRGFDERDGGGGEPVAIVNQAFVRRFVGSKSPLGLRVKGVGLGTLTDRTIIGVVNDAVYRTARAGVVPTMYVPMAQAGPLGSRFNVTVKLATDRLSAERGLSAAITAADPRLAFSFRDYGDQVRATMIQERLVALLSGFFGGLAMLLAALGLYGVTSYGVNRRRPELAVRVALGASTGGVVRLVLGRVAVLLLVGAAIGAAVSVWTARFVGALLFRVDARDPWMLAAAGLILLAVGLFAGWLPARGASRVDPAAVLRS
jgi:putative ABC transport system permease protein